MAFDCKEGFWWQGGARGVGYAHKDDFSLILVIRVLEFATIGELVWAVAEPFVIVGRVA